MSLKPDTSAVWPVADEVATMDQPGPAEWHERMLRSWHLALLRFAVTLDNADRVNLLAIANQMDRLGRPNEQTSDFGFFRRTTAELCAAIIAPSDAGKDVLSQHLTRLADARLTQSLAAALEIDPRTPAPVKRRTKPDRGLWRGLPSRSSMRA